MANVNKAKGTAAETAVVEFLREEFPTAERRALSGGLDKGDVINVPGWTIEIKSGALHLRQFMREADVEADNAGTINRAVIWKPPGLGKASVAEWPVIVPFWLGRNIMKEYA